MASKSSDVAFCIMAPTAAFITTFFVGAALFRPEPLMPALFTKPGVECKGIPQVIEDQTISPSVRVMQLGQTTAKEFMLIANRDVEPDMLAEEILIFRDRALNFGLVVLFVDGCATNYGKIDVRQIKDWLEELF